MRPLRPRAPVPAHGVAAAVQCRLGERDITLELRPYRPGDRGCEAYGQLQHRVYARHGVSAAKKVTDGCMQSCSHLVLAYEPDGALAGGVRIHARGLGILPLEAVLGRLTRLQRLLGELGDCVELSGTVVRPDVCKTGLSVLIVRAAVAAIPVVGAGAAVGFGHQRVLPLYRQVGFRPEFHLGLHAYPDSRYMSRVAVLADARSLDSVESGERGAILDMRMRMRHAMRQPQARKGAAR